MDIDQDVKVYKPDLHTDDRGFFYESYNQALFDEWLGQQVVFVQDNHSRSARRVIRGLHYQLPPFAQAKLVRVTLGAAFDVVVDIRRASPTFGRWRGFQLDEDNHWQLWIPKGFAHGFLALDDRTDVLYKTTAPYSATHSRSVRFDDPAIAIEWPLEGLAPLLSETDLTAPSLSDAQLID